MARTVLVVLVNAYLMVFGIVSASAQSSSDFYQRSNIKDALIEGDCERYGGQTFRGDVAAMAGVLVDEGRSVGGYRNVVQYGGEIYVLWSFRSGFIERTMQFCIFDY